MGQRSSKKADITTPTKTKNKVKRKKSKRDANGSTGVEEVSIQEKKDDAEIQNEQVGDTEPKVEAESSKKGETDSTGSGNAPTEIVEDSPGKETSKIAQLSEVQSPSEPSTSSVEVKSPEEKDSIPEVTQKTEPTTEVIKAVEPVAEVKTTEPEPVAEVKATEPEPVAEVKATEPEPVAEVKAVEPEPVAEVKAVEPEPVAEVKADEPEPVAEVKADEPEPVAEVKAVEPEPVAEVKAVEPEPVAEVKAVEPEPVPEVKATEPEPVAEVKAAEPELISDIKANETSPIEVKVEPEEKVEAAITPLTEETKEIVIEPVIPEPLSDAIQESNTEVQNETKLDAEIKTESEPVPKSVEEPKLEAGDSNSVASIPESAEQSAEKVEVPSELGNPVERVPEPESAVNSEQEIISANDLPEPVAESPSEPKDELLPESVPDLPSESVPELVSNTTTSVPETKLEEPIPEPPNELTENDRETSTENTPNRNSANIVLTEAEINAQSPVDNCNIIESDRINGHSEIQVNGINDVHNGTVQENDTIINGQVTGNGPSEIATLISWKHGGKEVAVCGDFCAWEDNCSLVEAEGIFSTKIKLPKGQHHIKFFVDGNWTVDESAPVVELEGHGQVNLLVVTEGCE